MSRTASSRIVTHVLMGSESPGATFDCAAAKVAAPRVAVANQLIILSSWAASAASLDVSGTNISTAPRMESRNVTRARSADPSSPPSSPYIRRNAAAKATIRISVRASSSGSASASSTAGSYSSASSTSVSSRSAAKAIRSIPEHRSQSGRRLDGFQVSGGQQTCHRRPVVLTLLRQQTTHVEVENGHDRLRRDGQP